MSALIVKKGKIKMMDSEKKEIKNLFVSIPMRGRSDESVIQRQNEILAMVNNCEDLTDSTYALINTMEVEPEPEEVRNRCWYLGQSIQKLAMADLIVFDYDYITANGCVIEKHIALLYKIPIGYISIGNELVIPDNVFKPKVDGLDVPVVWHIVTNEDIDDVLDESE